MIHKLRARAANESGFTLIELLIVIIILGILATIVLFATGTFTSDSKDSACAANAKILNIAEAAYSAKHEGGVSDHNYGAGGQLEPYIAESIPADNAPTHSGGDATDPGTWACA